MRRTAPLPFLLATAALLPLLRPTAAGAQQTERDQRAYQARIDTTFAFGRGGLVDLTQLSGDVVVSSWDRDEVRVRAWAERGRIESSLSSNRVLLRVHPDDQSGRVGRRDRIGDSGFEVTVPAGVRVKAETVSGDLRVTGTRAEVEASTTSGDVVIADGGGRTTVGTVSGDVTVTGLEGDLVVKTTSGDVEVRRASGEVRVGTVSGEVALREVTSRTVTARTTSGDVTYEGGFPRGGRYEFATHSGDVWLVLPQGVNAEMTMQSFSGSMDTDFPVTLAAGARSATRPRTLEFVIGDGGARVRAETFSGDVVLRREGRAR
jgi:DUF4097 and DUF4098 domain-containing protein YvlB